MWSKYPFTRMDLLRVPFTHFQNDQGTSFYIQAQIGSNVSALLFGPQLLNILQDCTSICSIPPMQPLLMYFMVISFLVINYAHSMFGSVRCQLLIQKYQTVKSFPYGNQSIGAASSLGIVLIIPVTYLCSQTLPQGIFTHSITWCLITPSEPFSLSLIMNIPQYYGTTLLLTFSPIKSCWNMCIVLYFMMNGSLPLNRRIHAYSFNARTTFMPLTNPPKLPFIWRSLYSICLLQYLFTLLLLLYFSINHLLLLLIPLQSQFQSTLITVLAKPRVTKPRVISPQESFSMKYMATMRLNIFQPPRQSPLDLIMIVPWPNFLI